MLKLRFDWYIIIILDIYWVGGAVTSWSVRKKVKTKQNNRDHFNCSPETFWLQSSIHHLSENFELQLSVLVKSRC